MSAAERRATTRAAQNISETVDATRGDPIRPINQLIHTCADVTRALEKNKKKEPEPEGKAFILAGVRNKQAKTKPLTGHSRYELMSGARGLLRKGGRAQGDM